MEETLRVYTPYTVTYIPKADVFAFQFEDDAYSPLSLPRRGFGGSRNTNNGAIKNGVLFASRAAENMRPSVSFYLAWDCYYTAFPSKENSPAATSATDLLAQINALYTGGGDPIVALEVEPPLSLSGTTEHPHIGWTYPPENANMRGVANGYASLDSTGHVPAALLPALSGAVQVDVYNATTTTGGAWSVTHNLGAVPRAVIVLPTCGTLITDQYNGNVLVKTTTACSGFITRPVALAILGGLGTSFAAAGVAVTVLVVR